MAKRKKHPKLPNGFGSIRFLKGNRRNPYCVQPASQGLDINGCPIRPKPLCYVDDWYKGFAILTAYNAGTYVKGMENTIFTQDVDTDNMHDLVRMMLNNYALLTQKITGTEAELDKTFKEVYEEFYADKYSSKKHLSPATAKANIAAFKNCAALHDRPFRELRHKDLQAVIDNCPLKHASLELIKSLFRQMYAYAERMEYVDKDYSRHVTINIQDDDEHGVPFSMDEIAALWKDAKNPLAEMMLIMIYTGHRISEYKVIDVDLDARLLTGGLKTAAGKGRTVPIHQGILPLIRRRIRRDGELLNISVPQLRKEFEAYCESHGMSHTPHDTRHTFSMLCDHFGVRESDKKRMLGHAFQDVTNGVYGHRDVEDLRTEINKILICH